VDQRFVPSSSVPLLRQAMLLTRRRPSHQALGRFLGISLGAGGPARMLFGCSIVVSFVGIWKGTFWGSRAVVSLHN